MHLGKAACLPRHLITVSMLSTGIALVFIVMLQVAKFCDRRTTQWKPVHARMVVTNASLSLKIRSHY